MIRNPVRAALLAGLLCGAAGMVCAVKPMEIMIRSNRSLVHLGDVTLGITDEMKPVLENLYQGLEKGDREELQAAVKGVERHVAGMAYTGEYGPLAWLCKLSLMSEPERKTHIKDPSAAYYYDFFMRDKAATLREYLGRRFQYEQYRDDDADLEKSFMRAVFLEAVLIFNDPERESYEHPEEVLKLAGIKKGEKVADIGCGFGYYTWRLARLVGDEGLVYAVDIVDSQVNYVRDFAEEKGFDNIRTVQSVNTDVSLPEAVDVAFLSSLYHRIYICLSDGDRRAFMTSLRRRLKPAGRLVIVENAEAGDGHDVGWSTVKPELLIAQLQQWGFSLDTRRSVSSLRYVLVFTYQGGKPDAPSEKGPAEGLVLERVAEDPASYKLTIDTDAETIHIGSLDSFDITDGGIQAGKHILNYIDTGMNDTSHLRKALEVYENIVPKENYGGEYTALQWFCWYFRADEAKRAEMIKDPLTKAYFHFFADDNCATLREYLMLKYRLVPHKEDGEIAEGSKDDAKQDKDVTTNPFLAVNRRGFLEDFILFNNPQREKWEFTSKIMKLLPIKKGDKVADIGCGPGYYSHRFSPIVGENGRIFALDTKPEHIDFLKSYIAKSGETNIVPIVSTETDICVKEKVDVAYMCSLYHVIYALASYEGRTAFMKTIHDALKDNGLFIVVDNGPVRPGLVPYHGCHISKELAIPQIEQYGYKLKKFQQIVPQRYMLIFEKVTQ